MSTRANVMMALLLTGTAPAYAGGGATGGATEITQIANNIQLGESYVQQAQQTIYQMQQYQTMLQNLQRLNPSGIANSEAQKLWRDHNMNSAFRDLYRVVVNGQSMAYSLSNIDQQFRMLNPGSGNYGGFDYQNAYKSWSDTTRAAYMGSLRMAAIQGNDLQTEGDVIAALSADSNSAVGQLNAVQAGNQIGIAMVSQLQKLRQLQISQINAQQTAAMAQQGRQGAADALLMEAFTGTRRKVPSYQQILDERRKQQ